MAQAVFHIEGMTCEHCVRAVGSALSQVPGVTDVKVDLTGKKAVLAYQGQLQAEAVLAAVAQEGYRASLERAHP